MEEIGAAKIDTGYEGCTRWTDQLFKCIKGNGSLISHNWRKKVTNTKRNKTKMNPMELD